MSDLHFSLISVQRSFEVQLQPGEIKPVTGIQQDFENEGFFVESASFLIKSQRPKTPSVWKNGILVSTGGKYKLNCAFRIKRSDIPGLDCNMGTGSVRFEVLSPRR